MALHELDTVRNYIQEPTLDADLLRETGPPVLPPVDTVYRGQHRRIIAETQEGEFDPADYNRVALYYNPGSRRALRKLNGVLEDMQIEQRRHGMGISLCETSIDQAENEESLEENITPDTIIYLLMGDGGAGKMLQAIRAKGLTNPVVLLPGGGKNDKAWQLLGRDTLWHPGSILSDRELQVRKLRPILATIALSDGTEMDIDAYSYASQGFTSKTADGVNDSDYRKRWLHKVPGYTAVAEASIAVRAVWRAGKFTVRQGEDGANQQSVEIMAVNGSRMAGILKPTADLLESGFRLITIKNRRDAVKTIAKMLFHREVGRHVSADEVVELHIESAPEMYVQVNGDQVAGKLRRLQQAADGVNVITDRS